MKKLLPFLGITLVMAACNTLPEQKADTTQQSTVQPDTTGMAAFNAWKAQNELASLSAAQPAQQAQPAPEKTRTIIKYVPVKSKPAKSTAPANASSTPASTTAGSGTSAGSGNGGSMNNESSQTAQVEEKKGWSKAAKGAVIGGVAGAAGGAILNKKNRVVGAVIGGVIGAAGGYGIGRGMDKNDGRIDYSTAIMN